MTMTPEQIARENRAQADETGTGTKDINSVDPLKLCADAYSGMGGFKDGSYLVRHTREANFKQRQGYSYYINFFRPIVHSLVDPIFKRDPGRDGDVDVVNEFLGVASHRVLRDLMQSQNLFQGRYRRMIPS